LAVAGAACSGDNSAEEARENGGTNPGGGDTVTIAGCLNSKDGNVVLTAAPDPAVTVPARVGMGERDTHSYVLVGGNNLQAHLGRRVEVSGTLVGDEEELERETETESQATPTGTSGGGTPTVETKEEVDIEVRQLNVANVRELAANCDVTP
jgi:hypothetical protein